ncbi:nitroreductase family protein [Nocardiopsis dassonvillei]|nr:nitroreductase family protein [Nocardiopsis dassonvillei]
MDTGSSEPDANRCPSQRSSHALQTLTTRRAVRAFADRPVDDSLLDPMLDAMLAAPSASNKQAWAFVAVRERRALRLLRAFSPGIIELPPLVVAACFDRSRAVGGSGNSTDSGDSWDEGMLCVAMAVENLLLAAHCLGLGGCPSGSFRRGPVRRLLGLPDHLEPLLLVPIGHPARPLAPAPRRDRNEVVSHERWGT